MCEDAPFACGRGVHREGNDMETKNQSARNKEDRLTTEEQQKLRKKIRRNERAVRSYQFFLLRLAVFILVVWVLFFKIVGLLACPTGDMHPRIDNGDMVLYYRLDTDVRYQDVIVLEKALDGVAEPKIMVLRVIAVAGDTVEITEDNRVVVNGNTLIEPDIYYATPQYEQFSDYPLTLQPGQCFVLADSRNGGVDSRYFGPVTQDEILGTVITIVRRNNL